MWPRRRGNYRLKEKKVKSNCSRESEETVTSGIDKNSSKKKCGKLKSLTEREKK